MRRNYVAVMLGLALTVSSISAFASEGQRVNPHQLSIRPLMISAGFCGM